MTIENMEKQLKNKRLQLACKIILICISCFILLEVGLRYLWGFCDALLYIHSDKYEYIAQPNQDHLRFGAHIHYNSFSQRSTEPNFNRTIILGLGDSVLFGGSWMDQDSLASTIFTQETGMQMLNISAGSWGPDNCAAYLKEKGTFNAKAMILVCSSHDAYDVMSYLPVVGIYPNYPNKQYHSAIIELIDRYLLPKIKYYISKTKMKLDPDETVVSNITNSSVKKKSKQFNPGFNQLKSIADSLRIPFGIYLHAETNEIATQKYNDMGNEIIKWAQKHHVYLLKGIECGETSDMYKDAIHYNEKGQKHLAKSLIYLIKNIDSK